VNTFVDRVRVYPDAKGEWRWQALAGNNEIVATSGEGYVDRGWAEDAARRAFPGVSFVVDDEAGS